MGGSCCYTLLIALLNVIIIKDHGFVYSFNGSWEAALHNKLFKDRVIVRPALYFNETVQVGLSLVPTYLQALNTAQQRFSIIATLHLYWYDYSLKWNPEDYGSATYIRFAQHKIWTPDFGISNSATSNVLDESTKDKYKVALHYTGHLVWFVSETFTTTCRMDPTLFPFDTQECKLIISGWGTDATYTTYTGLGMHTEFYLINNEWHLIESYVATHNMTVGEYKLPEVEFSFKFKRESNFYVVTMIMPLCLLSFLGLLVFPLPPDSEEKISFGITCLLSFYVMQASITENLPASFSAMPYIVMMIFILMVFNALSITMTVITISVFLKKPHRPVPVWLENIFITSNKIQPPVMNSDEPLDNYSDNHNQGVRKSANRLVEISGTEMSTEEKWLIIANAINRILFLVFSSALVIMLAIILPLWLRSSL